MRALVPGKLAIAVRGMVAVFLLMPLIAVIPVSFTPNRYLSVPDGEWSCGTIRR
jgi:putative spermidine/putrescine transport system permease protein